MIFSFTHYQHSLNDFIILTSLFWSDVQTLATLTANFQGEWPFNPKSFYGNVYKYLNMVFIYPLRIDCSGVCQLSNKGCFVYV